VVDHGDAGKDTRMMRELGIICGGGQCIPPVELSQRDEIVTRHSSFDASALSNVTPLKLNLGRSRRHFLRRFRKNMLY